MAPKAFRGAAGRHGGRGHSTAQDIVKDLHRRGFAGDMVRQDLRSRGYSSSRISQLMKAGRLSITKTSPDAPDAAGAAVGEGHAEVEIGKSSARVTDDAVGGQSEGEVILGEVAADMAVSEKAFSPVPPDGNCFLYVAVAARDVESWVAGRDEHGNRSKQKNYRHSHLKLHEGDPGGVLGTPRSE